MRECVSVGVCEWRMGEGRGLLQLNNPATAEIGCAADECLIEGGESLGFLRSGKVQGIREVEAGAVPFEGGHGRCRFAPFAIVLPIPPSPPQRRKKMIRSDQWEEEKKTDLSDRRKKSHFKAASRRRNCSQWSWAVAYMGNCG